MSTIERLRKRSEFLAVTSGRRFHTERMTVQGQLRDRPAEPREPGHDGLRIGFTITKKVGHATERNRIRRRLRAAVTALAPDAPQVAADIVLVARRPALEASFEALKADLGRALSTVTKPSTKPAKDGPRKPGPHRSRPAEAAGDRQPASSRAAAAERTPSSSPTAQDGHPDGQ